MQTVRHDVEEMRSHLLPRVLGPKEAGYELVPGQLAVGLFLDTVEGARAIDKRDVKRWALSPEALMSTAVDNLRLRSSMESWYPLRAVPGMQVYLAGDGNAASRLLLIRELIKPWPLGGVLASVPTPDQLLVVPMDDLDHLATVQVLVQSGYLAHSLGSEPVIDQVFWHDGVRWHHVQVNHLEDTVEVLPPPGFLKMVERLASLQLAQRVGEA